MANGTSDVVMLLQKLLRFGKFQSDKFPNWWKTITSLETGFFSIALSKIMTSIILQFVTRSSLIFCNNDSIVDITTCKHLSHPLTLMAINLGHDATAISGGNFSSHISLMLGTSWTCNFSKAGKATCGVVYNIFRE